MKKSIFLLSVALLLAVSTSCSKNGNNRIDYPLSEEDEAPPTAVPAADSELTTLALTPQPESQKSNPPQQAEPAQTSDDITAGYALSEPRQLFNGVDLSGWVNETGGQPKGWIVEDSILRLVDPQNGGDLLTDESFDNYVLTFEWRFGQECNSGVKYKIEQPNGKGWIGLEYQVQDDAHVEDGKIADRTIASLFDVLPAKPSTQSASFPAPETKEPTGKFRQGKIVVCGNRVEHWIDGERALSFTIGSDEWNQAKADSKFKNQKNYGLVSSSPILLQAHGYPVDFRNITIQTLTAK